MLRARTIFKLFGASIVGSSSVQVVPRSQWVAEARIFDYFRITNASLSVIGTPTGTNSEINTRYITSKFGDVYTSTSITRDISTCGARTSQTLVTGETCLRDPTCCASPVGAMLPYYCSEFNITVRNILDRMLLGPDYVVAIRFPAGVGDNYQ